MKTTILKYLLFTGGAALTGAGLGWLMRCAGGG